MTRGKDRISKEFESDERSLSAGPFKSKFFCLVAVERPLVVLGLFLVLASHHIPDLIQR